MKLQATSSKLLRNILQKSAKCAGGNKSMPVLDSVLLSQKSNGEFSFTTSTGFSQITIPAPLAIIGGKFDTPLLLPLGIITSFLSTIPDCVITLNFNEENMTLSFEYCLGDNETAKAGCASVSYFSGKDFPKLAPIDSKHTHIELPYSALEEAVSQSSNFVKADDFRPVLCCMCMDVAEDFSELTFVGTDGTRLYKRTLSNDPSKGGYDFFKSGEPGKMLLHLRNFRALSTFEGCEVIDIKSDGAAISFTSGGIELICKSVEGRYPNYKSVIPRNNPVNISIDKKELLSVLKRVSLFSEKNNGIVELHKDGMFLNVSAHDYDLNTSAEDQVLIINSECEDGFSIGFKEDVLSASINAIQSESVRIQMLDAAHAATIVADTASPDTLTLCMPMHI